MVIEAQKPSWQVWPPLLEGSVVGGIALSVGILYSDSFYNEHSVARNTTSVAVTTATSGARTGYRGILGTAVSKSDLQLSCHGCAGILARVVDLDLHGGIPFGDETVVGIGAE